MQPVKTVLWKPRRTRHRCDINIYRNHLSEPHDQTVPFLRITFTFAMRFLHHQNDKYISLDATYISYKLHISRLRVTEDWLWDIAFLYGNIFPLIFKESKYSAMCTLYRNIITKTALILILSINLYFVELWYLKVVMAVLSLLFCMDSILLSELYSRITGTLLFVNTKSCL